MDTVPRNIAPHPPIARKNIALPRIATMITAPLLPIATRNIELLPRRTVMKNIALRPIVPTITGLLRLVVMMDLGSRLVLASRPMRPTRRKATITAASPAGTTADPQRFVVNNQMSCLCRIWSR
jgi:hypothetical protein